MARVEFKRIHKYFGNLKIVEDLNLRIEDGEFLVLVGPSGCGKSTTLRMLAGLDRPTYGAITIGDRDVTTLSPRDRDIAMVFQSYALYPHMSVFDNLAFGMKIRRESKAHIKARVEEVADTLNLGPYLKRKPAQLSGGQRQRIALGRAMLREPQVFLLDEPLSNLDAALRGTMRAELSRIHNRLGVTTVYVTHDQVEAMTMGTRIVVMRDGVIQHAGPPEAVYDRPANLFVATFIGSPKMNLLPAIRVDGSLRVPGMEDRFAVAQAHRAAVAADPTGEFVIGLRNEDIHPAESAPPAYDQRFTGQVKVVEPLGPETYVTVAYAKHHVVARFGPRAGVKIGDTVELAFRSDHMHVFSKASGRNLLVPDAPEGRVPMNNELEDETTPGQSHARPQAVVNLNSQQ